MKKMLRNMRASLWEEVGSAKKGFLEVDQMQRGVNNVG